MRKLITIIIILTIGLKLFGQDNSSEITNNNKYFAWFYPSNATHVYGFMFNFSLGLPDKKSIFRYPITYGCEINLNPLGIIYPFAVAAYSIDPSTHTPLVDSYDSVQLYSFKKVHGLQIGLANTELTIINGMDINLTGSMSSITNGLTISLLMNKHYLSNGLTVAILGNHDTKCNGVQIGLINSSMNLKGVQIGLWNKNQKRKMPLLNWSFK